jgi:hypothetical protein
MKQKIWTFGDSYTSAFKDMEWADQYTKWKGYVPKVYGELISDWLNIELSNKGTGGFDNYSILQMVCNHVDKINSEDIIIIGWSNVIRFRLVNDLGSWCRVLSNYSRNYPAFVANDISDNTINEILVNREHPLHLTEIRSWIKLLDFTFHKNTIIHWSPFHNNISNHSFGCAKYEKIRFETNGKLDDGHFSETGQFDLAKDLMEIINNTKSKKII